MIFVLLSPIIPHLFTNRYELAYPCLAKLETEKLGQNAGLFWYRLHLLIVLKLDKWSRFGPGEQMPFRLRSPVFT